MKGKTISSLHEGPEQWSQTVHSVRSLVKSFSVTGGQMVI